MRPARSPTAPARSLRPRAEQREAAARDAAAGEVDVVEHASARRRAARSGRCGAARGGCARAAGKRVTSSPNRRMVPEVGRKSPVTQLKSVVLPAPFEPRTARRSPGRTVRVTSVSAASAPKQLGDAAQLQRVAGAGGGRDRSVDGASRPTRLMTCLLRRSAGRSSPARAVRASGPRGRARRRATSRPRRGSRGRSAA